MVTTNLVTNNLVTDNLVTREFGNVKLVTYNLVTYNLVTRQFGNIQFGKPLKFYDDLRIDNLQLFFKEKLRKFTQTPFSFSFTKH